MATATIEDFMSAPDRLDPESEDLVSLHAGQLVEQFGDQSMLMDDGVVVVETSDGEIMDVEKRIAFLSPILQLGYVRLPSSNVSSNVCLLICTPAQLRPRVRGHARPSAQGLGGRHGACHRILQLPPGARPLRQRAKELQQTVHANEHSPALRAGLSVPLS